ncbi:Conserved protein of unknown function [Modestobacter italicus]|uniref:Uncharacterized protein n=1 Tax=Modestobacter italicus (strain DSM 44449 / CECT 9708 / BC 501) TaxID=2732864 RepID=I4ESQ1_MODI5|nr:Conserved protein of unknown function [Modestobacter marinus]
MTFGYSDRVTVRADLRFRTVSGDAVTLVGR